MKYTIRLFIAMAIGFFYYQPLIAQETKPADDYSDYSYLWETPAKTKKSKKKDAPKPPTAETIAPQDSVKTTSEQPSMAADSIPNTAEVIEESAPPLDSIPDEQVVEEPTKEPKVKKERPEQPPVEDFRAGMATSGGSFSGGVTYTQINGEPYVGLVLSPEFSIKKVGVGLNVPILYGLNDKSVRTEMFKDGVGVLRLVRYVRYGVQKKDPIYVKVGELNGTMIGFGSLINNYTNTASYEKRKVGIHYDFNVMRSLVGMEGLYSDVNPSSLNLFAVRPYVRPLIWTSIPIVRTLEIGSTVIKDKDQTKQPLTDSTYSQYGYTKDGIGAFGIDMGMILLSVPFIQIDFFAGYSKLNVQSDSLTKYAVANSKTFTQGSGLSAGMNFRFHFIANVFSTDVRIERLSYSNNYLPQFFDGIYELNKDQKIQSLLDVKSISGIYGSLTGQVLNTVKIGGSLLLPDNITAETPATVRVNADLDRLANKISVNASYIKGGLTDLGDAFKFDDKSLAKVRFIYHMNKFLATGVDYYYYWEQQPDSGGYKATRYIMPYFGVSIKM
jgi:hypothetical protein